MFGVVRPLAYAAGSILEPLKDLEKAVRLDPSRI
jgi:hypothetical protein